jgi:DNA mismatch repair protein MSH6
MQSCLSSPDLDDFIVPDESDEDVALPQKRKRLTKKASKSKSRSASPPVILEKAIESDDDIDVDMDKGTSTAQQWTYDPENLAPLNPRPTQTVNPSSTAKKPKAKAHTTEPEKRHTWLATRLDADKNPVGHPDYDPRTLYIPPHSLNALSAFEQQYWKIKSKFMDTVVFFKKGKFYELYEDDATIGHQMFDLKLTDRVNMRMVGVPESSLDLWANQFVAKGYKIARVDQMESALGKEMRERDDTSKKPKKEEKIIRRELAAVLTSGTLVDGGMLQDDMSTYCVAIKVWAHRSSFPYLCVLTSTGNRAGWLAGVRNSIRRHSYGPISALRIRRRRRHDQI